MTTYIIDGFLFYSLEMASEYSTTKEMENK